MSFFRARPPNSDSRYFKATFFLIIYRPISPTYFYQIVLGPKQTIKPAILARESSHFGHFYQCYLKCQKRLKNPPTCMLSMPLLAFFVLPVEKTPSRKFANLIIGRTAFCMCAVATKNMQGKIAGIFLKKRPYKPGWV